MASRPPKIRGPGDRAGASPVDRGLEAHPTLRRPVVARGTPSSPSCAADAAIRRIAAPAATVAAFLLPWILAVAACAQDAAPGAGGATESGAEKESSAKPEIPPAPPGEAAAVPAPGKPGEPAAAGEDGNAEAAEVEGASPGAPARPDWPWARKAELSASGQITEKYRVRHAEGEWDQDLVSLLDLRVRNLGAKNLNLHLSTGVFLDTVGRQGRPHGRGSNCSRCHPGTQTVFYLQDSFDSYESPVQGRVYDLFVEARELAEGLDLRVGRQFLDKGEPLRFDGVRLGYAPEPLFAITAFGGLPVDFSEGAWGGQFVVGAYVDVYPGVSFGEAFERATKLTVEYLHVHEREGSLDDDYISVQASQTLLGNAAVFYAKAGFLDGKTRDVILSAQGRCPGIGTEARFRFLASPSVWGDVEDGERELLTGVFSPYLGAMGLVQPYRQFEAAVHQPIGPWFAAEIAWAGREPTRDGSESAFNHDFDRYSGTAFLRDPFGMGLDASAWAEFWASDGPEQNDNHLTWGFDLSWRSDRFRVALASRFLKYRVVYEPDASTRISEKTDVRVVSVDVDVKPIAGLRVGLRYEMETDDGFTGANFDTLAVRASFTF